MGELSVGVILAIGFFLIVLATLWFLLPFAVFGVKGKLDDLIAETKRTNEGLKAVARVLALRDGDGATVTPGASRDRGDESPDGSAIAEAIRTLEETGYAVEPDGRSWKIRKGRSMHITYSAEELIAVARSLPGHGTAPAAPVRQDY